MVAWQTTGSSPSSHHMLARSEGGLPQRSSRATLLLDSKRFPKSAAHRVFGLFEEGAHCCPGLVGPHGGMGCSWAHQSPTFPIHLQRRRRSEHTRCAALTTQLHIVGHRRGASNTPYTHYTCDRTSSNRHRVGYHRPCGSPSTPPVGSAPCTWPRAPVPLMMHHGHAQPSSAPNASQVTSRSNGLPRRGCPAHARLAQESPCPLRCPAYHQ